MNLQDSPPVDNLQKRIYQAIEFAIQDEIAKETKFAVERITRNIQERTAFITARVLSQFRMQYIGDDLVIKVQFDKKESE